MTRLEAFQLLKDHASHPRFYTKIGVGSRQQDNPVDLEDAIAEFDRCARFDNPNYLEFVFVFMPDEFEDSDLVNEALDSFNLGPGRFKYYKSKFCESVK